ncbi:diamine acetyltransferase 2 isoform X2 [Xenopus tropicalis]|uniref:Diamine acetyltransferase 2 isoform X2 n=1 Tax=Xenopus tropicalis TaxID=8364 RepID=A0A8J0QZK8_XENTR|nr:diamine acetyltransferase 2 isoform X2 [Xenopus tropicalis]
MVTCFALLLQNRAQELADYEKLPDQVRNSVEGLRRDGFEEPSPLFRCLVAEPTDGCGQGDGPALIGFALCYMTYSTWKGRALYMEDLYVMPQYRGKGVGSQLLAAVAEMCLSLGCCHLQFSVLDWNSPAISFYHSRGAKDLTQAEGWHMFRVLPEDLHQMISARPKPGTTEP